MKILLIKPPLNPHLFAPSRGEPLELEYLAAAVPEHAVEILDLRIDHDLQATLEKFRPRLVGVTAYTCDVPAAKEVVREVKKFDSSIITVTGGNHATFVPADFADTTVDAVFLGMADFSFRDFVNRLEGGQDASEINNLALVRNGRIELTAQEPIDVDLDSIPLPARHLTARYRRKYRDVHRNRTAMVLSSRGCPFRCTFCACWKLMNGKYFTRSPESIVKELASLGDDIDCVHFADDNTLHNSQRAWRLCQLLQEEKIQKKLSMYARADFVVKHPDLIEALKNAGLDCLTIGVESFREEELSELNKRTSVEMNNEAIRILRRLEIRNAAHLIVNPDYREDDFQALFRYICESQLFQPTFAVLTPLPGTELYERTRDHLAIRDYSYFDFAHSVLPTRLSRKDFYHQFVRLYIRSYSFHRYFRSLFGDLLSKLKKSGEPGLGADRLSFLKLCIVHLAGYPLAFKMRHLYKSEPLVRRRNKDGFLQL